MTTQQPEALRLAEGFPEQNPRNFQHDAAIVLNEWGIAACAELRSQHARITELEAQLSAIGAGGVSPLMSGAAGWQPIETAPKDGAEILGYTAEAGNLVLYWDTIGREPAHWSDGMSIYNREPTHWQPLPAAPSIAGEINE